MKDELVDALVGNYVYQKVELLKKAGMQGNVNTERLASMARPRIEKMADLVRDWAVRPDVLMEAVFAWAKYNKHPDGPMPNLLFSAKYLTKALSHYLQVPYEVVVEKKSVKLFLERMDFEFTRFTAELDKAGVTELATATSYPIEMRYLLAITRFRVDDAFYISQELLEKMQEDRRITMWLEHPGVTYAAVSKLFNKRKKQKITLEISDLKNEKGEPAGTRVVFEMPVV